MKQLLLAAQQKDAATTASMNVQQANLHATVQQKEAAYQAAATSQDLALAQAYMQTQNQQLQQSQTNLAGSQAQLQFLSYAATNAQASGSTAAAPGPPPPPYNGGGTTAFFILTPDKHDKVNSCPIGDALRLQGDGVTHPAAAPPAPPPPPQPPSPPPTQPAEDKPPPGPPPENILAVGFTKLNKEHLTVHTQDKLTLLHQQDA